MLASPLEQDTKVDIADLTHASIDGNGVFDVLMRAVNAHLQKEWSANRLKGTEYSTVYLGALESTMNASLQFLLARDKTNAELDILKQQLVNLKVEEANAIKQGLQLVAQTAVTTQQKINLEDELLTSAKQRTSIDNEIDVRTRQVLIAEAQSAKDLLVKETQISQTTQQTSNLFLEAGNITKQGAVLTNQAAQIAQETIKSVVQTSLVTKQELQVVAETLNVPKQGELIDAQKNVQTQQKLNLEAQKLNIPKEGALVDAQKALTDQKKLTEIDALLTATAQRSVLTAQATGFTRDAEQKAAEIMIRGFSVVATATEMNAAAASLYGISQTGVLNVLGRLAAGVGTTSSTSNNT